MLVKGGPGHQHPQYWLLIHYVGPLTENSYSQGITWGNRQYVLCLSVCTDIPYTSASLFVLHFSKYLVQTFTVQHNMTASLESTLILAINHLSADLFGHNIKIYSHICAENIQANIHLHWHWICLGHWNPSPWKNRTHFSCIINIMAANDLAPCITMSWAPIICINSLRPSDAYMRQ